LRALIFCASTDLFFSVNMTGTTEQEPPAKVVEQAIEQELRLEEARPKSQVFAFD
jgi:uncharacterized membrane protein